MNDQTMFSPYKSTGNAYQLRLYRNLLEIIAVFAPLAVCAYLGRILGLKTTLSGLVINLGYVLSILMGLAQNVPSTRFKAKEQSLSDFLIALGEYLDVRSHIEGLNNDRTSTAITTSLKPIRRATPF